MVYYISKSDSVAKKCLRSNICQNKRGFTVIEIFIVLGIIAVLSALAVGYYNNYLEDAKMTARTSNLKAINDSIGLYYKDHMAYPYYRELDTLLKPYMSLSASEILQDFINNDKRTIFYKIILPLKKDTAGLKANGDIFENRDWKSQTEMPTVITTAPLTTVCEIVVSDEKPEH